MEKIILLGELIDFFAYYLGLIALLFGVSGGIFYFIVGSPELTFILWICWIWYWLKHFAKIDLIYIIKYQFHLGEYS